MLRIRLLGEQTVLDDSTGVVRTRSSRAVALLGYLAVHAGAPQSRQRIAGLFWPDSGDGQALTNLRRELHQLRQTLGADVPVLVTATELSWRDDGTAHTDVRVFAAERAAALACAERGDRSGLLAHADAALAEYRGELLPGLYDDWVLEARAELQQQCTALCDLLRDARIAVRDPAGAAEVARRRIALSPLEEAGYQALMRLQADLGDVAAAVSTYHRCASVLESELGIAPSPATRGALQSVMERLGPSGARPAGEGPARPGRTAARVVGRAAEVAKLHETWRTAARGRAGLALISGGAGVGKSRLLLEVADAAKAQGAVVVSSRCFASSPQLTLAPVADWLRHPAVRGAAAQLDAHWRAEVDRLIPGTSAADRAGPQSGVPVMLGAWQRHRFFEGLARALLAPRRPTLLVLENVHWCDQETLSFVSFLLALDPGAPLLVAGTLRNDEPDDGRSAAEWVARMRRTGLLVEQGVSPLDKSATAELAEACAGRPMQPGDLDLLHATTGGFPLFVIEAVRAMAEGATALPEGGLTEVLRHRLARASEVGQEVAGLAAAVGTNFTLDLLVEASDLRPETVVGAVDELWRRRILREYQDGYDFSHDLIRDVAYAQVSPAKRWLLHRRIAQGLELLHPEDSEALSALLAYQYERGGRPERAIRYYRRAAGLAAAMFAHGEAIRMLEAALAIIRGGPEGIARDRQELAVLEALAAPLNAKDGYSSARLQVVMEHAAVLAERLGDGDALLDALAGLWTSRFVQGRTADGYEVAVRMLQLAEPDDERSGPAHFALGGSAISLGRPAEGVRHLDLAARLSSDAPMLSVGTRPDVHSTAWAAHGYWLLGDDEHAARCAQAAITRARAIDRPYSLAVALAYGAVTDQMRGDLDELRRKTTELTDRCERYGFAYYREWALVLGGWVAGGRAGLEMARRGVERLKAAGSFARMPYWLALVADLLAREGRPEAALATLDGALASARVHDDVWWVPEVMRMRAAYDDPAAAATRLRDAAAVARAHGSVALLQRCERDAASLASAAPPITRTLHERDLA
ncbi:MAG TPA: AAA family ATPase [Jatrophihabitans sp.]|nr:AAA family ATPase [Jatrophihabitans sp.]